LTCKFFCSLFYFYVFYFLKIIVVALFFQGAL